MKTAVALAVGAIAVMGFISGERQFALAARRWEHDRTPLNLLHVVTSGFFLAEDVAALR
jgi:hypothetical protein